MTFGSASAAVCSRRRFLHMMGAGALAASLPGVLAARSAERTASKGKRPNILLLSVDDLRTQLGCYGHKETLSPNIDRLAASGMLFERAYCNVPICMASRVGMLTGTRPAPNVQTVAEMKREVVTLPALLKRNGYHCVSNGKNFHHMRDSQGDWSEPPWRSEEIYHGPGDWAGYNNYDLWQEDDSAKYLNPRTKRGPFSEAADVPDDAYQDGKVANRTIADLQRLADREEPFFLACGFWRPHLPFNAPKKYWDLYDRSKITIAANRFRPVGAPSKVTSSTEINGYGKVEGRLQDEDFHREARHGYYACVSYVDAQVGRVLAELDRLGLAENTVVMLWGDHGWLLGEHDFWGKHNTLNDVLHAPLMIRAPGLKPGRTRTLVEFADVYPTLCDLTRIPTPAHVEGKSFAPTMADARKPHKAAVFSRWGDGRAVKTDRYLYTEWATGERMLFDHHTDPNENVNIANHPKAAPIIEKLKTEG